MANAASTVAPLPIDQLPFAQLLREDRLILAGVESVHVLGIAILVGTVVAFDLRVLGLGRRVPVSTLARQLLPLAVAALALVIPSGLALFAAHASTLLVSVLFGVKMGLIFVQGALAVVFHTGPFRGVAQWDVESPAPRTAKAIALASLLGWVAVLVLGQLLGARDR